MTLLSLGITMTRTITDNNDNPHLNFLKGTVLEDKEQWIREKEQGVGIRDKG